MVSAESALKRDMQRFEDEFIKPVGPDRPHVLIPGDTGSGKTTTFFWLLERLVKAHPSLTYFWFDLPKDSESLTLTLFKPCRYIIPYGLDIEITGDNTTKYEPYDIEIVKMEAQEDIFDPWKYLRKGWMNVFCIEPYILKAKFYGPITSKIFENLIYHAVHEDIITPLTGFVDEVHNVAPSHGNAYDYAHAEGAKDFQHNAERVRGHGIQLITSTQMYTELKFPVRKALGGLMIIKRGAVFPRYDEQRLWEASKHWQRLDPLQMVIRWRDHTYSQTDIKIHYYPRGRELGRIKYIGDITGLQKKMPGEFPCDKCKLPHEIEGANVVCRAFMQILNRGWLKENGCNNKEAKA